MQEKSSPGPPTAGDPLIDQQLQAEYHTAVWDGSKAASGVHLYRLQAGDFVESKKMILIK